MPVYITPPPRNPLARLLAVVIAVLVLAGAFALGVVALLVVVGMGLVVGVAAWIRSRFFAPGDAGDADAGTGSRSRPEIIEAEYTVVSRERGSSDTDD